MNYHLREFQTLQGHADSVLNLSWKPSSGINDHSPPAIATCSDDRVVNIWELSANGFYEPQHVLERHTRAVGSCRWSPSGRFLATASLDTSTAIWEKNLVGEFEIVDSIEPGENEATSVSWNASGSLIAISGNDDIIWIWELYEDHLFRWVTRLQDHWCAIVTMVLWNPLIDVLFSCSSDETIKVWAKHMEREHFWQCVQTLNRFQDGGHEAPVRALSFNTSGNKMVSCSDDLTIKIWGADIERMRSGELDYAPWRHLYTLFGYHFGAINSVHWSREGIICSGAADGALCFFAEDENSQGNEPTYRLLLRRNGAHHGVVTVVQWNCRGKRLLASGCADGNVKLWSLVSPLRL